MSGLMLKALLSYLLGSIVGSLLIARLTGAVDIRTLGSGNAGATNALRHLGKGTALLVLLIDVAKGFIATRFIAPWVMPGIAAAGTELSAWAVPTCGLLVILGHVYPIWYGFRGGKGFATLVGAVAGIQLWLLAPMAIAWFAAVILFGYVSLASMLSAIAVAIAMILCRATAGQPPYLTFGVVSALLVIFTHRTNIARLRAGTESRARRLWLLGTRRDQG
jgi:acyl phosphate:glycerol-3-phosphate acyltransferase